MGNSCWDVFLFFFFFIIFWSFSAVIETFKRHVNLAKGNNSWKKNSEKFPEANLIEVVQGFYHLWAKGSFSPAEQGGKDLYARAVDVQKSSRLCIYVTCRNHLHQSNIAWSISRSTQKATNGNRAYLMGSKSLFLPCPANSNSDGSPARIRIRAQSVAVEAGKHQVRPLGDWTSWIHFCSPNFCLSCLVRFLRPTLLGKF